MKTNIKLKSKPSDLSKELLLFSLAMLILVGFSSNTNKDIRRLLMPENKQTVSFIEKPMIQGVSGIKSSKKDESKKNHNSLPPSFLQYVKK